MLKDFFRPSIVITQTLVLIPSAKVFSGGCSSTFRTISTFLRPFNVISNDSAIYERTRKFDGHPFVTLNQSEPGDLQRNSLQVREKNQLFFISKMVRYSGRFLGNNMETRC